MQVLTVTICATSISCRSGGQRGQAKYRQGPDTRALVLGGLEASFWEPGGLAILPDERYAYLADTNNHRLRVIDPQTGRAGTITLGGYRGEGRIR